MNSLIRFDHRSLLFVQERRSRLLNFIFVLLTYTGTGPAWWISAVTFNIINFFDKSLIIQQQKFLFAFFAPLLSWFMSSVIKKLFLRRRPSRDIEGFIPLIKAPDCHSFPSAHAASTFAFFFILCFVGHPFALWVGVWASLVSFSRVYVGVHYPSDIAGGIFVGAVSALILKSF